MLKGCYAGNRTMSNIIHVILLASYKTRQAFIMYGDVQVRSQIDIAARIAVTKAKTTTTKTKIAQ